MKKVLILLVLVIAVSINSIIAQNIANTPTQNTGNIYHMGNLGIGTTTPESILTVYKSVAGGRGGEISIVNWATQTTGNEAALNFGLENSTYGANNGNAQIKARLNGVSGASTDLIFSLWSGSSFNEYLRILSNGNIGIGTTAPAAKLSILGEIHKETTVGVDGVFDNLIKYGHKGDLESNNSANNRWHGIDATITAGEASSNKLKFRLYHGSFDNAAPIDVLTLLGNGNVGIGTTSPLAKLHIFNEVGAYTASDILMAGSIGGYNAIGAKIQIQRASSLGQGWNFLVADDNTGVISEALRIKHNGNVGIGTTNPYSLLDVRGRINTADRLVIGTGEFTSTGAVCYPTTIQAIASYHSPSGNFLNFYVSNGSPNSNEDNARNLVMALRGDGNVGIGTTTPQYKLAVKGTIGCGEVKVEDISTWADFVFHPTYKLRPLGEVEQFIKTNNHLPEIPSATEVKENGVGLGEMNAKLLQKIEELTLYMIEQNKKMDEQQKQMVEQQKMMNDQRLTIDNQGSIITEIRKEMSELKEIVKK